MGIRLSLLAFLLYTCTAYAQLGTVMPNWKFTSMINECLPIIELSKYKGKVIILDFWNTGCTSNYDILPELAAYQKEFKDKLKVIIVADDDRDKVNEFFNERKALKALGLPIFAKDTLLTNLFSAYGKPQVILIGSDSRIKAITDLTYITKTNVELLIAGKTINVPVATEIEIDFNKPLLSSGLIKSENVLFHSLLTNSINKMPSGAGIRKLSNDGLKVYLTNSTLINMYAFAYSTKIHLDASDYPTKIILHPNPSPESKISDTVYKEEIQNRYCYELILSGKEKLDKNFLLDYMQDDLDHKFNIVSKIERRNMKCYILRKIKDIPRKNNEASYTQKWLEAIELNNTSIKSVAAVMKINKMVNLPIITDGVSTDKFTITLRKSYKSIEELRTDLQKGGLDISVSTREQELLILNKL